MRRFQNGSGCAGKPKHGGFGASGKRRASSAILKPFADTVGEWEAGYGESLLADECDIYFRERVQRDS
jgi:hypothetical protein